MNKFPHCIALVFMVVFALAVSCNDPDDPQNPLNPVNPVNPSQKDTVVTAVTLTALDAILNVSSAAQTAEVTVRSNCEYTVSVDEVAKEWLAVKDTKALTTGKLVLSIAANDSYDKRKGGIILKAVNAENKVFIEVVQNWKNGLVVAETDFELLYRACDIVVNAESNFDFDIRPDVDWIRCSKLGTKALSPSQILLHIEENKTLEPRTGNVTLASSDGDPNVTITVAQHLGDPTFTIEKADTEFEEPNRNQGGKPETNLWETGVYSANAILVECLANGTRTMDSLEVRRVLSRNVLSLYSERPFADPPFDGLDLFELYPDGYHDDPASHGTNMAKELVAIVRPFQRKLGTKILLYGDPQIDIVTSHPELYFYFSSSFGAGSTNPLSTIAKDLSDVQLLQEQPNLQCSMRSIGNTGQYTLSPPSGEWNVFAMSPADTTQAHNTDETNFSDGLDGVMGALNSGRTNFYLGAETTLLPSRTGWDYPRLWAESSDILGGQLLGTTTSPATPVAAAKYYLSSCLNQLVNPEISSVENRDLIRRQTLDNPVYVNGHYYFTARRIYPGGMIFQYYSTMPESVDLSADALIPIGMGVFRNSVIVGPGVVDAEGNMVTEENFSSMMGKSLFLSPSLLRQYCMKAGDAVSMTEYLCLDSDASGAGGKISEAFKYIEKQSVSYTLGSDLSTLTCGKTVGSSEGFSVEDWNNQED